MYVSYTNETNHKNTVTDELIVHDNNIIITYLKQYGVLTLIMLLR